ncbi:hypothetical protein [Sphingorhabdus sp. SMR4y]|uniref:hypothetical protein n=1 Tax=Sphingorhabdus sp. SMR4y TaxID=2584094 RepID=UPI000B5FA997|nr:hypothetical protein [Sphingorhabdus sp. SMR4y]ASK88455.1 hypothetical protein SPHFLASMR4Y_01708 [Sphingorhabdus sp. SMR4y]
MANLFQPSLQPMLDANGNPVSGGKWYFYLTGTTTAATIYSDQAGTTAMENPVEADASGIVSPIFLDPDVIYKVSRTDADGVAIGSAVDPVRGYDESDAANAAALTAADAVATAADRVQTGLDKTAAETAKTEAEAAQAAAEEAETNAVAAAASTGLGGALYADTTAGLAAVGEGEYFYVENADGDYVEYQDLSGVATATGLVIVGPDHVEEALTTATAASTAIATITPAFEAPADPAYPNIYDPDIATSGDGQYANNSGNALSSSAKWHFSGFVPGTPGQDYVIDLRAAVSGWVIKRPVNIQQIHCYTDTAIGTFHSYASATFSESDRKVTFTMPAGASYFAWNCQQGGYDPSTEQFAAMRAVSFAYDATDGETELYSSYRDGSERKRKVAEFDDAPVTVVVDDGSVYVRQPYNDDFDIVRQVDVSQTIDADHTGAVQFGFVMRVPKGVKPSDTVLFFESDGDAPYDARPIGRGGDTAAPENLNNTYLGGGHGFYCQKITSVAHGLSLTDVGDVGTDGAAKSWVLVDVPDVDTLTIAPANEGTATAWDFDTTLTGSTITFSAAGAVAFSGSTAYEDNYLLQSHAVSVWLDGVELTADGVYRGYRAEVQESYGIPNPADWLTQLIAGKGAASPRLLSDSQNATHVDLSISYQFGRFGEMVTYFDHYVAQGYARTGDGYWGAQQWLVLFRRSGSGDRINQYIPDLSGTVGGYDFSAIADIESNSSSVNVMASDCVDPSNPASHFAQICKTSGGDPRWGFAYGYARHVGIGVPATRATLVDRILNISNVEKQYPGGVDGEAGATASAGENHLAVCWNQYYDMADNQEYTCNNVVEFADGTVHWTIDIHDTLDGVWINHDAFKYLIGKSATVIDSTAFTLHSAAVTPKGLRVSTTGGYGRAVVSIV